MRLLGVNINHPDRLVPQDHRHRQHRRQIFLSRQLAIKIPFFLPHIRDHNRLFGPDHLPGDAAVDLKVWFLFVFFAQTLRGFQHQFIMFLVIHQNNRTDLGIHHLRSNHHNQIQNFIQIFLRSNAVADLHKLIQLPGLGAGFLKKPRVLHHPADLLGQGLQQSHCGRRIFARRSMLNVDDPGNPAAKYHRHRQERLIFIFRKNIKILKPGVLSGVLGDDHRFIFFRHPAGNPLTDF